tara:strand:+ start:140 stop:367 length:228 start_codon:yes stop_codon:yes gene_type:complete
LWLRPLLVLLGALEVFVVLGEWKWRVEVFVARLALLLLVRQVGLVLRAVVVVVVLLLLVRQVVVVVVVVLLLLVR